ncbi:YcjF family protein [Mucilaginibacter sp. OK098]|uniref:YcjF family protein n=1 Tax=Mucilaginibacter sp. OK098 TaxID=1855297 RepID=UPI00091D5FE3|nr:DUF697 domain-containing protein [Mucilaginibacter sp. OK098]MDB5086620.1 hypothetical protein [Mucilaginibacter sp.]SHL87228.1 Uncharacterized conserved protein, DUF697 family [Mucilaginibacter sp. OK098]
MNLTTLKTELEHGDSLQQIASEAVVRNYMMWTGAAGIIPLPIIDTAAISAIQLAMLNKIGDIYKQEFSANWGKSVIGALVGGYASTSLGLGIGMNIVRAIPFVGGIASLIVLPGFAAATTYALGQVFILHFESGGTILDFDPVAVKDHYIALVKKGHTVVSEVAKNSDSKEVKEVAKEIKEAKDLGTTKSKE